MAFLNEAEKQKSISAGFTSTDPAVAAKVKAMGQAAGAGLVSKPTGTPTGIPGTPNTSFEFQKAPEQKIPKSVPVASTPASITPIENAKVSPFSANKMVTTTEGIRSGIAKTQADASDLQNEIVGFRDTAEGRQAEINLQEKIAKTKSDEFTINQQKEIAAAGEQARLQYDSLIRDAERAKQEGLPKATIAAGQ